MKRQKINRENLPNVDPAYILKLWQKDALREKFGKWLDKKYGFSREGATLEKPHSLFGLWLAGKR